MDESQTNPVAEPASPVSESPVEAAPRKLRLTKKTRNVLIAIGGLALLLVGSTALVYMRPPTDGFVRGASKTLPYPAAVVGNDVITLAEYLAERDALNSYFESNAQTESVPSEEEITKNILDTLVHKAAVQQLADQAGVVLDPARADAFFSDAVGGADPVAFEAEVQSMFGWTTAEFRERVINPVVLAMQLGEALADDTGRQDARKAQAQAAYDRLAAGETFAVVAADVSSDASAATGGDVGYVKLTEIPAEWQEGIGSLAVGGYSPVLESEESYLLFQVTDRTGAGEETQVKLSIVSVPKITLEEQVQEYLSSVRVWKFIGRS